MKYIYETKLLKQTQNKDPVIEKMVADGWSLHKNYKEGLVFKKQVPDSWLRAWFVVHWELQEGESVEVKTGPYGSEDEAKKVAPLNSRIERTWMAPPLTGEPAGSRIGRLANMVCGDMSKKIEEVKEEVKKEPEVTTNRVIDEQGEWEIRTRVEPVENAMNIVGVRQTVYDPISMDEIPRVRNYIARTTGRRASPSRPAPRARNVRPGQPQIKVNILESMRNFGQALEVGNNDEPSEEDLRIMERNRQAAKRHDQ